jgi:hypothetical protein
MGSLMIPVLFCLTVVLTYGLESGGLLPAGKTVVPQVPESAALLALGVALLLVAQHFRRGRTILRQGPAGRRRLTAAGLTPRLSPVEAVTK